MNILNSLRLMVSRLSKALLFISLVWPQWLWADVKSDFELGSGGMKVVAIEGMMTNTIYVLMCLFGGWVMVHSVRKLITADETSYHEIIGLVMRAMLILIVMILVLT